MVAIWFDPVGGRTSILFLVVAIVMTQRTDKNEVALSMLLALLFAFYLSMIAVSRDVKQCIYCVNITLNGNMVSISLLPIHRGLKWVGELKLVLIIISLAFCINRGDTHTISMAVFTLLGFCSIVDSLPFPRSTVWWELHYLMAILTGSEEDWFVCPEVLISHLHAMTSLNPHF